MKLKSLFLTTSNYRTLLPRLLLVFTLAIIALPLEAVGQETTQKPLKVFVLVGQSNMQGHAQIRTLPHLDMDPATQPILGEILSPANDDGPGDPRMIDDVWISYLSSGGVKTGQLTTGFGADDNKIGPELTFGIYMQKRLEEPILIIKTAWGGKSINTDFRSPSAGPYQFQPAVLERLKQQGKDIEEIKKQKEEATGVYYRSTIDHVQTVLADIKSVYPDYDAEQGYELSGLVWFQGWNDMVDQGTYPNRGSEGGYDQYSEVLCHLIRDFRKDLDAPELPFVVGVLGVGGPTSEYGPDQQRYLKIHQGFRDAMAAPAQLDEFDGNVVAVLTENSWDLELDGLIARNNKIKSELKKRQKEGSLEQKDWQTTLQNEQNAEFTQRELTILNTGVSNAAFHYLGSGKIMAQIGKSFAESMPLNE